MSAESLLTRMSTVSKIDWFLVGCVIVISALFFNQGFDMRITVLHSFTLIDSFFDGTVFSFYDTVYDYALSGYYLGQADLLNAANYSFLLYLILALINLPLYLFEWLTNLSIPMTLYIMFDKVFIVAASVATMRVVKNIGLTMKMSDQRASWLAFALLSSPILMYGNIVFGQFDIFAVYFMSLALLRYLNKEYTKFCLLMALAIDIKVFGVLAMIVLILLIEKRILHILKFFLLGMSVPLLEKFIFSFSEGKQLTDSAMASLYQFKDRVFQAGIQSFGFISFIVVGLIVIMVLAYMKNIESEDDFHRSTILYPLAMYVVFFSFILYHPQWLVVMIPFTTLGMFLFKNTKAHLILDIALGATFISSSTLLFVNNTDAAMINSGIIPLVTGYIYNNEYSIFQTVFIHKLGLPVTAYYSAFVAMLFAVLLTKINFNQKGKQLVAKDESDPINRGIMWVRLGVILIYILPSLAIYFREFLKVL